MFVHRVTGVLDNGKEVTLIPGHKYNITVKEGNETKKYYAYAFKNSHTFDVGTMFYFKSDKRPLDLPILDNDIEWIEEYEQRYICVAACPELDDMDLSLTENKDFTEEVKRHCIDTMKGRLAREESSCDYCPCGNVPIWKEYEEE